MSNNRPQRQSSMSRQAANNPRDQSPRRPPNSNNQQLARQSTSNSQMTGAGGRQNSMSQALVNANNNNIIVKNKDGEYAPVGYTKREIHAAEKAELISVARAMNDDFEPKVRKLFNAEVQAAENAIRTGLYIGYRCPEFTWDCIRVYGEHKCFCGHLLKEHDQFNGKNYMLPCHQCKCKRYAFIPSRPEDVGEFWFARRRNFDVSTYRVKCRCKHSHESHDPNLFNCTEKGCGCRAFNSDFLCAACDQHWEKHETFFETEQERREKKLPYGQAYKPFDEFQEIKQVLYDENDNMIPIEQGMGMMAIGYQQPHASNQAYGMQQQPPSNQRNYGPPPPRNNRPPMRGPK